MLRPEGKTQETIRLLLRFNPSPDVLLNLLRRRINNAMLREIASADYAVFVQEHLRPLRRIRDHGDIPVRLEWYPREVLELIRWEEPSHTDRRRHLMRAFCCAVLLKAGADPANAGYMLGENETLAQLLFSVLVLGRKYAEAALRFVSWRVASMDDLDEERPFFAMAVLLLCVCLRCAQDDPDYLVRLAAWVEAEEAHMRAYLETMSASEHWLLGLTCHDLRHTIWRSLARTILVSPHNPHPTQAAEVLMRIGKRVLDEA